jgi:signal transduction histidine kinase
MRRSTFREGGLPHELVVLSDLSQALREEERQAWKRLIRVLRHELGNSLAPIKSMASTLSTLLQRESPLPDWKDDMKRGLTVIADRSESLSRFLEAYGRLARLPQPRYQPVNVGVCIRKVAALTARLPVEVVSGPELVLQADGDQIEQLLINLIRNATDAALETGGKVRVGWSVNSDDLEVWVDDEGPGLAETANLFVPFFTTKAHGSGIGLVLSRQIAEAHGGSLTLLNRKDVRGCEARLRIPLVTDERAFEIS